MTFVVICAVVGALAVAILGGTAAKRRGLGAEAAVVRNEAATSSPGGRAA